jgi:DNA polymerase I-like protein with 3'-5' exonuclease and polymerase domains
MKLNYIGSPVEGYTSQDFFVFREWVLRKRLLGLDTETNVCNSILDRQLITIQLADKEQVWVIQWSYLVGYQKLELLFILQESFRKLIIHGSTFEYTVLRKYDCILKNVWDTYTQEQVLNTGKGAEEGAYGLEAVIFKRFGITLDKSQRLLFGDDVMTKEKIEYAGMDVCKSVELYEIQLSEQIAFDKSFKQPFHKGLRKTGWWDNEFKLVAGDLEYQGVLLDTNKWIECYNKSYPAMLEAKAKLDKIVIEEFGNFATEQGWFNDTDRFESIWGSSEKKKEILQLIFPNIKSVTKLGLKEYLRDNDPDFPIVIEKAPKNIVIGGIEIKGYERKLKITGKEWENHNYGRDVKTKYAILKWMVDPLDKEHPKEDITRMFNNFFYSNFKEFMLERNYIIPANTLSLNWGSWQQKLLLFQHIEPSIPDTKALTIESNLLRHNVFRIYMDYIEVATLITKYGLDYLKHIQADGRIRTVYNTVLDTGRLSAKEPNLLGLPKNPMYRAAFVAPEGFKIVDADYDSEELCFIAVQSGEEVWLEHLAKGHDLHGVNAELVLKDKWKNAALPECEYYKSYSKCHCPEHKKLRNKIKAIDFGLAFGLSAYGLAARQHITEEEAKDLIDMFFKTFPKVHKFLVKQGNFGVAAKMISENGTGRVRWFDNWKVAKKQDHYGQWVYVNPEEMRGVMRSSMNFPIQAMGSSVLKVACVLLRRWINQSNLREHVQFMQPYHDQILLYAREGYEQVTATNLERIMKLSGKLLLKNDLLRATASISTHWIKD